MTRAVKPTTPGWVYVLESSRPGVVKIGLSTRSAEARARELDRCADYAAYGPFREVWSRAVPDCPAVEAAAHRMLAHKRVQVGGSPCRELFRVDTAEACRVLAAVADSRRGRHAAPSRRPTRPAGSWRSGRRSLRATMRGVAGLVAASVLAWLVFVGHLLP